MKLKKPGVLKDPTLLKLANEARQKWSQVVEIIDPPALRRMLDEIYGSENFASSSDSDGGGNRRDPRDARLPSQRREQDARRPQQKASLVLKDFKPNFKDGLLSGKVSFVLQIPTKYGDIVDSPTLVNVTLSMPSVGATGASIGGQARVGVLLGVPLVGVNYTLRLNYDPRDIVKAAVAVAKAKKIEKAVLEKLLSSISLDVSAFSWVLGLPTWTWLSTSSLLPMKRPLHGTAGRLLPAQIGAMPDSTLTLAGTIPIPSGVFFDTIAPAVGVHRSKFGRSSGYSLTAGFIAKPNLDQLSSGWPEAISFYGYADLYYVKRVSDVVDVGFGLTYAVDPFTKASDPGPAHLHYLKSKHQPWLPTSNENVPADESKRGHRFMFKIQGTHDLFGG